MNRRYLVLMLTLVLGCGIGAVMLAGLVGAPVASANNAYHSLAGGAFLQDWPTTSLITITHNWSGVPSILGYDGAVEGAAIVDPQTVLADTTVGASPVVSANVTSLSSISAASAGVFELHPASEGVSVPSVALHASSNYDAPFLLIHLNSSGRQNVRVQYDLIDIDASNINPLTPVALQFRVGTSGPFTNVPLGYVADASDGPSLKGRTTHVDATLPAAANNKPQLQVRILTTNNTGNDEFIAIDNINISSAAGASPTPTNTQPGPTATTPPATATTVPPTPNPNLTRKVYVPQVHK